ncbi:MAG: ROK family protein [Arenicellales bacterium]
MHLIGIDLGGTKTEGIVMTPHGATIARRRVPTPGHLGYDAVIGAIRKLALELESIAGQRCSVGLCTPGSISASSGRLKNSNTLCLNGRDIKSDIERALERPVLIENDANCFALSEAVDGAASDRDVVFGVIMGTGVGGGLVFNKRLHPGRHHIAGEWGHNILEPGGPPCYCGRRGCVEVFLSGPGLLRDWADDGTRPGSVNELLERARAGEADAERVMERFFARFGAALATVINILDPDAVVLGGGLSNIDGLYSQGVEAVRGHVFNDQFNTPILKNRHGDSSGVRGAARLWTTPTD